ncbi:hypothetical protein [Sinomicrobium oceani]|uniref:hypothetical protein n=1 Tax=Sinomicrobium oceani TaxID=1150368 RepID=UPI001587BCC8|nr:hypothetical protein [Sinomicrobium oceani]
MNTNKMEKYGKSICATCRHRTTCVLTAKKSEVISCSEYDHTLFRKQEAGFRYV